jgi:hypothetical protein
MKRKTEEMIAAIVGVSGAIIFLLGVLALIVMAFIKAPIVCFCFIGGLILLHWMVFGIAYCSRDK